MDVVAREEGCERRAYAGHCQQLDREEQGGEHLSFGLIHVYGLVIWRLLLQFFPENHSAGTMMSSDNLENRNGH